MKNVENDLRDISNKKFNEASKALNVIGSNPIFISKWPRGEIGRRKGLKIPRPAMAVPVRLRPGLQIILHRRIIEISFRRNIRLCGRRGMERVLQGL